MPMLVRRIGRALRAWVIRFWPFVALFLVAQTLLRLLLSIIAGTNFIDGPWDLVRPFAIGFLFDVSVLLVLLIPGTLYWTLLPARLRGGHFDRAMTFSGFVFAAFMVGFVTIGEVLFFNEFGARFNFIAVDYLVYTREVVGNIRESYPVVWLLAGLGAAALILTLAMRRYLDVAPDGTSFGGRVAMLLLVAGAAIAINDSSTSKWTALSSNNYANEISSNGVYTLVRAFFNNEIDYRRFYAIDDDARVNARIRELVAEPGVHFTGDAPGDITRDIVQSAPVRVHRNVVLVTIESLSASYMSRFGNRLALTPNLDALADRSLFFTHMLATGTRTVRGLEAVTLSVPPTPGQSILRRPGNANLFSLGSVLRDHGYSATYLYGGDGYFDNMNAFFTANGYRVIDRAQFKAGEVSFSNAWGVCDEDLFARALREADASHATGQPFFQHVMTVSNHRPYTYPAGRIDPPHGKPTPANDVERTREGGVKYTDYAIGRFLEAARDKPWFANTLFVFVADHTASSAGKIEVDPDGYHIPAIFYAPGFVSQRRVDRLVSQIDVAPTILGLLGMSYRSRFVGADQSGETGPARAFISNYQKVGLIRGDDFVLLGPHRDVTQWHNGKPAYGADVDAVLAHDVIAYYQHASHWQKHFAGTSSVIPGGPGD